MAARADTYTTTVRLPRRIYEQAKCVVDEEKRGTGPVVSMNEFIVHAVTAYLKMYKRRQIDAEFAAMAEDADYQKEASLLAEEFAQADWEALKKGEEALEVDLANASSHAR